VRIEQASPVTFADDLTTNAMIDHIQSIDAVSPGRPGRSVDDERRMAAESLTTDDSRGRYLLPNRVTTGVLLDGE